MNHYFMSLFLALTTFDMGIKQYVEDTFAGSLPAFIAAFTQDSKLTPEEADAIRKMIDMAEEK